MMAASRTWNIRLNLDEFNALAASVYTDGDRALLFQGLSLGLNGGDCPAEAPSAFCRAHQMGSEARAEAEAFRSKMQRNGFGGGRPSHRQDPGEPDSDYGVEIPAGLPDGNQQVDQLVDLLVYQNSTQSTIHNPTAEQPEATEPRERPRRASAPRFVAPTEEEWVAYCTATWPDWHPTCAAEAWAHYTKVGWKSGSTKIVDWKAAARTSHGKATQWGTLQPKGQQPRSPQQMPDWVYKKIQELKESIRRAEIEMRNYGPRQAYSIQECSKRIETMQAEIKRLEGGS